MFLFSGPISGHLNVLIFVRPSVSPSVRKYVPYLRNNIRRMIIKNKMTIDQDGESRNWVSVSPSFEEL